MNWKDIKLLVYDFDGVMTDNRVLLSEDGVESAFVNRSDGLAISKIKKLGILQIIISTETNPIVAKRSEKLNIDCYHGVENKLQTLKDFLIDKNFDKKNVAYIGNDINDEEVMKYISFPIAPADAYPEILTIASYITKTKGGYGVIREIFSLLETKK
jgi:3-deoxy-D-manno-octulosonate 8-phosphate phosphatase (KDO 8-P phosphatase)